MTHIASTSSMSSSTCTPTTWVHNVVVQADVATGTRTLLAQSSSPFWPPTALVPRADGSIVVALGGLGPLLVYTKCDDTSCEPAVAVNSTASNTPGKGGVVEIEGRLCLVVGSTAVYGEGGRVVCELEDGSLERIAGGDATAPANPLLPTNAPHDELTNPTLLAQGIAVKSGGFGILYVVTRQSANEYGYSQGSIHAWARRAPAKGETQRGEVLGAAAARCALCVQPRGPAIDSATDRLYVVERNTLRGFSYETFNGDVLAFCARGVYDCSAAQNSGECVCAAGYGGFCDIDLRHVLWRIHCRERIQPTCAILLRRGLIRRRRTPHPTARTYGIRHVASKVARRPSRALAGCRIRRARRRFQPGATRRVAGIDGAQSTHHATCMLHAAKTDPCRP